ncbi:MAG: hypothetical protein RL385_1293 [Pseudomonadota bacterium]
MIARLLILSVFALAACTRTPFEPEDPLWGKQPCDHCRMLVSEPVPAAQAVLADGSRKHFDDVGCLAAFLRGRDRTGVLAWVRGPDGKTWVNAFTAQYGTGRRTPMDYGFLAEAEGISFAELEHRVAEKTARPLETLP